MKTNGLDLSEQNKVVTDNFLVGADQRTIQKLSPHLSPIILKEEIETRLAHRANVLMAGARYQRTTVPHLKVQAH